MTKAPPSYAEATNPSTNIYLASRAPLPFSPPSEILNYTLDCSLNPAPFPSPENAWLARDINHQDWNSFLAQLSSDSKWSTDENSQRAANVVAEWNDKFFGPRHCRVDITIMPQQGGNGGAAGAEETKFEGLGFKVGNSFIGVSTGKDVAGIGLKLPGVLLGVATGSGKEAEKPAEK